MKKVVSLLISFLLLGVGLFGCAPAQKQAADAPTQDGGAMQTTPPARSAQALPEDEDMGEAVTGTQTILRGDTVVDEEGWYSGKEEVALYLMTYGKLPGNFMPKKEAKALGWDGGGLDEYALGMSIGGDRFGNYEGALPEREGRSYTECDIDTQGASKRGAKRIIYSSDGLIFYTEDHYQTFTLLLGEEP